jgi:hypothetical protein
VRILKPGNRNTLTPQQQQTTSRAIMTMPRIIHTFLSIFITTPFESKYVRSEEFREFDYINFRDNFSLNSWWFRLGRRPHCYDHFNRNSIIAIQCFFSPSLRPSCQKPRVRQIFCNSLIRRGFEHQRCNPIP